MPICHMFKRRKVFNSGLLFAGGAVLTSAFMLATKYTGWDQETVCRPAERYIAGVTGGDAELQIVKRHKYLPFAEDIVYAGVPFRGLTKREAGSTALEGGGYVNHGIFYGAGPLAVFRYIPRSHCRVTYFRHVDGQMADMVITARYIPY